MKEQPRQYYHVLKAANLSSEIAYYHHTFMKIHEKSSPVPTAVETLNLSSFEIPILHAGKYSYNLNGISSRINDICNMTCHSLHFL
jgi:hypothetical protein